MAKYPIIIAIFSTSSSSGVFFFSGALSSSLRTILFCECFPTANTIALPLPSIQFVPDNINGEGKNNSPLRFNSMHL